MLIEEIDRLLEKEMSPFKRKDVLNKGPRGGENRKANKWDCECSDYECTCKNKDTGRKKTVKIKKKYKKGYNKEYKQHMPYKRWRSKVRKKRDKKKS